ncbi:hypothetical protein FACS189468_7320 [Spirochaetia bacterium]|nr:hypothetical protein FACS189468_7320 [Spirochaetia bacterium]
MNEMTAYGDKRMTVKEVADTLGLSPDTVKISIRELFPDLMQNGKTTYLNEAQVTAVKFNLRKNSQVTLQPKTALEKALLVQQAILLQQEIIENLQKENEEMKPKVAFFDQVADSRDAIQMRDVAAVLNVPGYGRNSLFEFLRKKGVLDSRNVPYRKYQDQGYFRVIEQKWTDNEGETHISLKTLVYQRGVDHIRKLIQEAP